MSNINQVHYLRMATDICVLRRLDDDLQVLLILRAKNPFKECWALPGGRLDANENLDQCALRELREETGLRVDNIRQFAVFSEPLRDPRERTVSVAYVAWITNVSELKAGSDAAAAQWFSVSCLPDMAFDHAKILESCLSSVSKLTERE